MSQPFLLRRNIPGDGDTLFPLGPGRGQHEVHSCKGTENKYGPRARFHLLPLTIPGQDTSNLR